MAACIAMKCPNSPSPRLWWIGRCRACVASAGCADDVQHRHVLGVVIALMALSSPTPKVVQSAAIPRSRP